jgi:type IV secretion system protein VirD4
MSRVRIGYKAADFSEVMRYPGNAGHIVTIAPTGSGKGRDILIPALLDETMRDLSCLVVDPKGQLAAVTGPEAARMGKRVIMLNPFKIWPECIGPGAERFRGLENLCDFEAAYNPLATLDPASDAFVPDAEAFAQAIVYQEHEGDHWTDSARDLVTGLILYAAVHGTAAEKNLAWVRSTICNRTRLFSLAAQFHGDDVLLASNDANEFIAQKLGRFGEPEAKDNKEIGSIISTAVTQTSFMGNGAISKNLLAGSFLFRELRERPTVLYLILPGRRLKTCSRWFRLIVGAALNELMDEQKTRGLSVLLMLDEFAQLGPMKAIEDAFGIARDYALTLWPVLQDLNQLKRDYKDGWETMLANAGALQIFRPQDNTTAEYVSKRTADIVIGRPKKNVSEDMESGRLSMSYGLDWKDKKYLEPFEVREIGLNEFLLFAAGVNGVHRGARRAYWETPEFKGPPPKYSPDPYH